MLSSLSIQIPCGNASSPLPKLLSIFPESSNTIIGSTVLPTQLFAPQRSAIQMCPLESTATVLVDPQVRPSGNWKKFSTVRYGFGCANSDAIANPQRANNPGCAKTREKWGLTILSPGVNTI